MPKELIQSVKIFVLGLYVSQLTAMVSPTQAQIFLGSEFQIDLSPQSYQHIFSSEPHLASSPSGDFQVTWKSYDAGTNNQIRTKRFSSLGIALGQEIDIGISEGESGSSLPPIDMNSSGDSLVTWASAWDSNWGNYIFIRGRFLNSLGTPMGDVFQVNSSAAGRVGPPELSANSDGDFLVAWTSQEAGESRPKDILMRRFDSLGNPVGVEMLVINEDATQPLDIAAGAGNSTGETIVTWVQTESYDIRARRFDSDGTAIGESFQINSYTTGRQSYPSVAAQDDGGFVVVWHSESSGGSDTDEQSVQMRRLDSAGQVLGIDQQVNTYTTDSQKFPSLGVAPEGNFLVVWESWGSTGNDSSSTSIQGRYFDSAGKPVADEFQINTATHQRQGSASVAVNATGETLIVWESSCCGLRQIRGQWMLNIFLFSDGFESGDVSRWSAASSKIR